MTLANTEMYVNDRLSKSYEYIYIPGEDETCLGMIPWTICDTFIINSSMFRHVKWTILRYDWLYRPDNLISQSSCVV